MLIARYPSQSSKGYYNYATGTGTEADPLLIDFFSGNVGKNILEILYTGKNDNNQLIVNMYVKNNFLNEWYPVLDTETLSIKEISFETTGSDEDLQRFRYLITTETVESEIRLSIYSQGTHASGNMTVNMIPCFRPVIMPFMSPDSSVYSSPSSLTVTITNNDDGVCSWKIADDTSYTSNGGTRNNIGSGYQLIQLKKVVGNSDYFDYVSVLLSSGSNSYTHTDLITDNIEEPYYWEIIGEDCSIIVDGDDAGIYYDGTKIIGTSFVDDVLNIDMTGFTLDTDNISVEQDDFITVEEEIINEQGYPELKIFDTPGTGVFDDIPVYEDRYPVHQYIGTRSSLSRAVGVWTPITNVTELQNINNELSGNYYLTQNIDASATSGWDSGAGFVPIGNSSTPFTGKFCGNGFTISGLVVNRTTTDYIGLFGATDKATINYITMTTCSITGRDYVGGLIGRGDDSVLSHCIISGTLVSSGSKGKYGGIVGELIGKLSTATNCHTNFTITGVPRGGGFVGSSAGNCTYSHCTTAGTLTGTQYLGGFVGISAVASTYEFCSSSIDLTSTNTTSDTGGFGGCAIAQSSIFENCYCTGDITHASTSALREIGGFIGKISLATVEVTNCYCNGKINSAANTYVKGFIGRNASINITSCYWEKDDYGDNWGDYDNSVGTPLTTAEMYLAASFVNWDFNTVWELSQELVNTISWIPISTANQLQLIGNDGGYPVNGYYYLSQNVDCSSIDEFTPIGFVSDITDPLIVASDSFQGVFDGNGYKISNVTVNKPANAAIGFFGLLLNATVRNVGIENINVLGLTVTGAMSGAIAGESTVEKCFTTGSITSTLEAEWCGTSGFIGTSDSSAGGTRTIRNCYTSCSVTGYDLCGFLHVISENTNIVNCYSMGSLSFYDSEGYVGGFSRLLDALGTCTDCFWDTDVSGILLSEAGTGKTTVEMRVEETFTNWDFNTLWEMSQINEETLNLNIAYDGYRRIKIDLINNVFYTTNAPIPIVNNSSEGTYFEDEGTFYMQLYSESLDEYLSWIAIQGDDVYLPNVIL